MAEDKPRFIFKKLNIVTMWTHDIQTDICAICRKKLMDICIYCNENDTDEKCLIVVGDCGHPFHAHCIDGWVKDHEVCPTCHNTWNYQKTLDRDDNQ
jgi:hypothetical protein